MQFYTEKYSLFLLFNMQFAVLFNKYVKIT